MKKIISIAFVIILSIVMVFSAVTNVLAETIYYYYGYLYTYIDDNNVSLCGWNSDTTVLFVPGTINNRRVAEISDRAFKGNTDLTEVRFFQSADLERIGSFAFDGCANVDGEISLPISVKSIETGAFQNCASLDSIVFNYSIEDIPNQCCRGCSSLSKVSLKEGLKSIGYLAFADCTSLEFIEIPRSVTQIGSSAFDNCSNLTIQGYMDSYAEEYADSKGIDFEAIDAIVGDANYDKTLNIQDVTAIQKYKAGLTTLSKSGLKAADVTGDGEVSVRDATQIQRYLANIITDF
jgi:hypothetical protein